MPKDVREKGELCRHGRYIVHSGRPGPFRGAPMAVSRSSEGDFVVLGHRFLKFRDDLGSLGGLVLKFRGISISELKLLVRVFENVVEIGKLAL